jgi:hypothetical protein
MSRFLHSIFYASQHDGSKEKVIDDLICELHKWTIPKLVLYDETYANEPIVDSEPNEKKNLHELVGKSVREIVPSPKKAALPKHMSMFQSIFVSVFGTEEYMMIGNRMPNRELEEKQKMTVELSKSSKKLKECNHRVTNDNIQEILSGLYVSTKDEIMLFIAYSVYYNRTIYLVFNHSFLVFSPTKDETVSSENIQNVILLNQTRNHPKYGGSYMVDLEPTMEKIANIHETKIHLEHYAKPFKGISSYKMTDLEFMFRKISNLERDKDTNAQTIDQGKKLSKKELYDIVVEICCAGITRSR